MSEKQEKFKCPPRKYHPRGIAILYEDRDILVADKMSGLLTMSNGKEREETAYRLLTDYVRKGNQKSRNRIFIVHRLDRDASGVIVFAKNEEAKRSLQDGWAGFKKTYYVVINGALKEPAGTITSYLAENSVHKMYSVDDPAKGKLSQTRYKVLKRSSKYSLLEIDLLTGRKNQIRAHLAEQGCPVVGDKKYGEKEKGVTRLALHAASLSIFHPHTKEDMTFAASTPDLFKTLLKS